ncbi:MAG: hypothetical protein V3W20_10675 [Candidatus Neomarinimicrobiota bacterium]
MIKDNFKLFLFFVLIFACNRLFKAATSYQTALILHDIGLHIILLSVLFYLIFSLNDYKIPFSILLIIPICCLVGFYINYKLGFREAMISIGIITHILIFVTIVRIKILVGYVKLELACIWSYYALYEFCGATIYIFAQLINLKKYTYSELVLRWGESLDKSATYRIADYLPNLEFFLIFSFTFWVLVVVCSKLGASKNIPHDEINNNNIFLLITKPKSFIQFFCLIFNRKFVQYYSNGFIYQYSKSGIENFICGEYRLNKIYDEFIVIDTKISSPIKINELNSKKISIFDWYIYNPIIGKLSKYL